MRLATLISLFDTKSHKKSLFWINIMKWKLDRSPQFIPRMFSQSLQYNKEVPDKFDVMEYA